MKLTIKNVIFRDYNNQDNLYFEVEESFKDIFSEEPAYQNEKILGEETNRGKLWVKIWSCGIARFGFTQFCDPIHDNREYTWSSNASCINDEFDLTNTPYKLARYGAGIKDSSGGCYWAGELTEALALKIGEENVDLLQHGLDKYKQTIDTTAPWV